MVNVHINAIIVQLSATCGVGTFINLQARSIGLSFNDISLILGIIPALGAIFAPITGQLDTRNYLMKCLH